MIKKNIRYIDSHCHLVGLDSYAEGIGQILANAESANIVYMITIGIDTDSSKAAVAIARKYPNIFATIGIHPNDTSGVESSDYKELQDLYAKNSIFIKAFGEIGLDYYRDSAAPEVQRTHFFSQLELAEQMNLPVIIHNREADEDCLNILKDFDRKAGCVMHCFSGDYKMAKKVLDMGMYISLSGIVTFKNAPELHKVAQKIPLERLLIETDAPFLAPVPYRGKKNEPAYLPYIAAKIAELRNISIEETTEALYDNTVRFFSLESEAGKTGEKSD